MNHNFINIYCSEEEFLELFYVRRYIIYLFVLHLVLCNNAFFIGWINKFWHFSLLQHMDALCNTSRCQ